MAPRVSMLCSIRWRSCGFSSSRRRRTPLRSRLGIWSPYRRHGVEALFGEIVGVVLSMPSPADGPSWSGRSGGSHVSGRRGPAVALLPGEAEVAGHGDEAEADEAAGGEVERA